MILEKKIRIIIGSLNVGGTEKQLLKIVNYLAKKEWEIELITIKEKGLLAKYLNKNIKINNLNVKTPLKFLRLFEIIFKLFKIFRKDKHKLTHFFLPQAYIVGMITSIIARNECKLIMSRRSLNYYQDKFFFCRTIEKILHRRVDKILVNSKAVKSQLVNQENVNKNKIKVIHNGIEIKNNKKKVMDSKLNIVIIANLIAYKNHEILFKSLNLIKKELPRNWKVYCVGRDDGIKKNLVKLSRKLKISENITWIETYKIENILANCNLGILCSNEESFPNAILEYFSLKLPVITTNVGGCKEIVKNNKNGIVIKKNSASELSKAILYLCKNKNNANKLANEGFKTAKKKFKLEKMIIEHEKEYIRCVKS